jgi:hypothetical protein
MVIFLKNNSHRGSILILTIFAAIFLLGMTALVTDVGYMYYSQTKLQTAVNAGWKAGFDRMMQLNPPLTDTAKNQVIEHVKEVMISNGFSADQLNSLDVNFGENNFFEVKCRQSVGLFFARAMDFKTASIQASRDGDGENPDLGIVPLAIPHGVTKDLSKNFYSCDLFPDTSEEAGFKEGMEYILKLGSGGGNNKMPVPPIPEEGKILVPMDANSQSEEGFLKAYGAVFWCLRIDDIDPGFVPAEWLLGYRGGSFFLMNNDEVRQKLLEYGVNFNIITTQEEVQAIYDQANPNILDLYDRPRVAVYASSPELTPIEEVFQAANIPYGEYSLPGNWDRKSAYSARYNTRIYDYEVLTGALANYQWVHTYNEDFTGYSGGCSFWRNSCKDSLDAGHLGGRSKEKDRIAAREKMCDYCRSFYDAVNDTWVAGYNPRPDLTTTNCRNARRRCVDKRTYQNISWVNIGVTICRHNDIETSQCSNDRFLQATADSLGFTSDSGAEPKPQFPVYQDGSNPLPENLEGWFSTATKVQKMKWSVAKTIKAHVDQGGFLFAQGFSAETLELSLWQESIHAGEAPFNAYNACMAFTDFHYRIFPRSNLPKWYSDINTRDGASPFNLTQPTIPQCQNHGTGYVCDTGDGYTASFNLSRIKPEIENLGFESGGNNVKYLKGETGYGAFTYLAGDHHLNTETRRLVLNNLFLGSLVEKVGGVDGGELVVGKQKSNYGPIDPDNVNGGGANDYRDRFINGYNGPINLGDRLITEPGNQRGPTDQAVAEKLTKNNVIIVPITDIPPEVKANSSHNADAQTVYDLQGSDHPNGIYDPSSYGFESATRIIGFAKFRVLDPSEYTRDGDTYQTGDAGDLGQYQPGQVRGEFLGYVIKPGEVEVN